MEISGVEVDGRFGRLYIYVDGLHEPQGST